MTSVALLKSALARISRPRAINLSQAASTLTPFDRSHFGSGPTIVVFSFI